MSAYLAVDWGTTNLRAWRMDEAGAVAAECELPCGVGQIDPGAAGDVFTQRVRPALHAETLPALLCGMVGSTLGWREAPYCACPAGAADLTAHLLKVDDAAPARIVPGLSCTNSLGLPDVMRGEETQILGWLASDEARLRGDHVICHPGTHAKWVLCRDGRVTSFITAMTGELYDLLLSHSVLRVDDGALGEELDAFDEGLAAACEGDGFSLRLFSARARIVAKHAPAASARSYLSGLLIGAEVAAALGIVRLGADTGVHIIGAPALIERYDRALSRRGVRTFKHDAVAATLAGFKTLIDHGAFDDLG